MDLLKSENARRVCAQESPIFRHTHLLLLRTKPINFMCNIAFEFVDNIRIRLFRFAKQIVHAKEKYGFKVVVGMIYIYLHWILLSCSE